jgi:micrococcal nuclease
MKPLLLLITLLLVSFLGISERNSLKNDSSLETPALHRASSTPYRVLAVIDGDTIVVSRDGESQTVRLLGIDTPEVDPKFNPIECYGREATDTTKEKLLNQTVFLQTDSSQGEFDAYDRMLAYVFLADGTNLNQYLIAQGYAKEYTYSEPYTYQTAFRIAEKDAQINEKGLCPENS